MACAQITGARICGVASAVPAAIRSVEDDAPTFGIEQARKVSQAVGVRTRRVVRGDVCTSDLCSPAAARLLRELDWDPKSVGTLILVTQTPDYVLPATACTLQSRLGLSADC